MEEKRGNKYDPNDYEVDIQSCSAMDCTGLIPSLPAQIESYYNMYHYMAPTYKFKD